MKSKRVASSLLALALSAATASACILTSVSGVVSCPNGTTGAGIHLLINNSWSTFTSANGAFIFDGLPGPGTYTICVLEGSLPAGLSVDGNDCVTFTVDAINIFADVDFTLKGAPCGTPPPTGPCWLTGGGTIYKSKKVPNFSYGGVVNPGCSPIAAGGGNWNVVDHIESLHFKGIDITVVGCSGVPTKSPKVNVNIIDFVGTGTIEGVGDNPMPEKPVHFIARAIDASEPGAGKDSLYLNVIDDVTGETLMIISDNPGTPAEVAPVTISTGNLQIHTSSCN